MTDGSTGTSAVTIVLIHGLWTTSLCWERWVERYESRGYRVLAPNWPGLDGGIEQLRPDPSPIARLTVSDIAAHYERIIRELAEQPIIIGHSFGGTIVQLLLDRGLGAAGVAIHPSPVKGIWKVPWSTVRSTWPVFRNPLNYRRAVPLTLDEFHYAFTNTLNRDESARLYERYYVQGSGHVLFEGALANLNPGSAVRVDFNNGDRAPLLFIAGSEDHILPPSIIRANARQQGKSSAITRYKEFAGRPHFTLGIEGWEEVANYALAWAERARATTVTEA